MDDYNEYARMAKMMTKVHAKPQVSSKNYEFIENDNSFSNDSNENKDIDDDSKNEMTFGIVKPKQTSILDVSMEEEKEPLRSMDCNFKLQTQKEVTTQSSIMEGDQNGKPFYDTTDNAFKANLFEMKKY